MTAKDKTWMFLISATAGGFTSVDFFIYFSQTNLFAADDIIEEAHDHLIAHLSSS
jgi:hypothetical protein